MKKLLAASILILALAGCKPVSRVVTTWPSDGTAADIQLIHDTKAQDGDTITLPPGTFSFTTALLITKGITLQGQTTVTGAGTSSCSANDLTVISDDVNRANYRGILNVNLAPSKSFRLTGITFAAAGQTTKPNNPGIQIKGAGTTANESVRVDNCHFKNLVLNQVFGISGWLYGVTDHCFFEFAGQANGFLLYEDTFGGSGRTLGNGSFEAPPYFGTNKFWFIEDCTFNRSGTQASGVTDATFGGRFVFRHNYVLRGIVADHGTEAGGRGVRAKEVYANTFDFTGTPNGSQSGARGGSGLVHDNVIIGTTPNAGVIYGLSNFRMTGEQSTAPLWGTSDGTSVWDANVTGVGSDQWDKTQHTFTESDTPHVFVSGTATSLQAAGTLEDSTANFPTANGGLTGYSIHNPDAVAPMCYGSVITGNTATKISYNPVQTQNHKLIFAVGNRYELRRVLTVMDGCGRGLTDQQDVVGGKIVLHFTGEPGYPNPVSEPWYSWNNTHQGTSGEVLGFSTGYPTVVSGTDYFNLGNGFTNTPDAVTSKYVATLNGVDYTAPFTYPHPLVSGGGPVESPAPTAPISVSPTATAVSSPTATRAPSPTPSATSTATQTSTPTATATATSTPVMTPTATITPVIPAPTLCVVPVLIGLKIKDAQPAWERAGFTTEVIVISGAPGHTVASQSVPVNSTMNCDTTFIRVSSQ